MPGAPETRRYLQQMTRFSSAFALLADMSMFVLGGSLKRKEKLSARLGDILSHALHGLGHGEALPRRGCPKEDLPLLTWAM